MLQQRGQVTSSTRLAAAIARVHNLHRHTETGYVCPDPRRGAAWHPQRPISPPGAAVLPIGPEPITAAEVQRWLDRDRHATPGD